MKRAILFADLIAADHGKFHLTVENKMFYR